MIDLSKIPINPGCYLYKDKNNQIIYIGKAKNLKKRVTSYFTKNDLDPKTQALVENIYSVDFIVTKNELEAFLLENNLIKKNKPKYNVIFKDSKEYTYLSFTKEDYPRLFILREKPKKGQVAFGPFTSAENRDNLLKYINKYFKLRTCKTLPKIPCIRYHIGQCSGACIQKISKEEYQETIKTISNFLKGNTSNVLKDLEKRMEYFSKINNFESALVLRDQINAVEYLSLKQNVEKSKSYNQDLINFIINKEKAHFVIFNISKGILINKREFSLDVFEEETILEDFILKHYSDKKDSLEIIIPQEISSFIVDFFKKKNKKIKFIFPKTGEKKELLDFAYKNIEIKFFENTLALEDLKQALSLKEVPKVIECFDISHLSGKFTVGSMVQFKDGQENKKEYRRFKIKSFEGNNDFKGIEEIVKRRYSRLLKEGKDFPNLVVIDGGKGQLSSAKKAIDSLNLYKKINLISLAKKEEEIFLEDNLIPLNLSKKSKALKLLQRIRDEAHRFAITYNRLLRKKEIRK
ncbi:MAG: excinuclease ABC subunit UvrC [Novosphingobium sp.]|nr:excinuclease ABC subunit UvrC [Novosphingobium sp.]